MMEFIGSIVVLLGAVFHFSAGLGMLRMPDAYTRMQAGTKASTLGNTLILAGLAFYPPGWTLKLIILIYFVLMTNPVSSHALARAAHRIRIPMARDTTRDALRDARKPRRGSAGSGAPASEAAHDQARQHHRRRHFVWARVREP